MVGVGGFSGGDWLPQDDRQKDAGTAMEKSKVEIRPLAGTVGPVLRPPSGRARQFLAAAVVSILPFIFGSSIGWSSPVQTLLQSERSPVGQLSDEVMSWLASLTFLGGIAGSFLWSRIADGLGRKMAGYSVAIPFIIGWALTALASDPQLLMVARFVNGIGGSGALILTPTYISEIAQDSIRGAAGSFVVLYMNAGIVFAYSIGAIVSYEILNYMCLAVPVVFLALFIWMPESPEYLWSRGSKEKALGSLLWLRSCDLTCVQEETMNYNSKCQQGSVSYSALVCSKGRRKGMIIGLGLFACQQFCGILAILSYTSFIFEQSGSSVAPDRATIIVGLFQLFASFISSIIVDRSGRKILLLISYLFMGLSLSTLGMYFYLSSEDVDVSPLSWVPVASLSVHVLTYALGAGPVPYVVLSETLPTDVRGLATSIIILWGTVLGFVSVKIFPFLVQFVGLYGCFWFFAFFSFFGFVFTLCYVPETKGFSLQQILVILNGGRGTEIL